MDYSVIIPSCRRPHMLREALDSVLRQTRPPTRVILVIDEPENRSRYAFLPWDDNRLQVEFTGGGVGAAVARNRGLDHASGEFVFFLDDDDWWYPTKVEKQIQWLVRRPDCIGVTCWREIEECGQVRPGMIVVEDRLNREIRTINYTGSLSFFGYRRRGQAAKVKFDERLASSQDFDFYIRLARYGRIAVVPEILVRYRVHDSERITDNRLQKIKDRRYLCRRHWNQLSASERLWNIGMIRGLQASTTSAVWPALQDLAGTMALLIVSARCWSSIPPLVWQFWKQRQAYGHRLRADPPAHPREAGPSKHQA